MNGLPLAGAVPVTSTESPTSRLSTLFDTHHARLYRLARRLTASADDALDLVQDTFLRAARSPASVPVGRQHEEAWLVRVLINLARDRWRRTAVRQQHDAHLLQPGSGTSDEESALLARLTVWRALDTLTPRRRAVVVLHELEGLTVPAIAALLGISAVTVRWHLSMGRRNLARALTLLPGDKR